MLKRTVCPIACFYDRWATWLTVAGFLELSCCLSHGRASHASVTSDVTIPCRDSTRSSAEGILRGVTRGKQVENRKTVCLEIESAFYSYKIVYSGFFGEVSKSP